MADDDDGLIVSGPLSADDGRNLADLHFEDVFRHARSEGWMVVMQHEYFSMFLRDLGRSEIIY